MNFNQLYYFWIVSRSRSLTSAAEQLRMTQPNLSHQMGRLETAIGRRLLVRSRQGVSLSDEGLSLAALCARMFEPAADYLNGLREKRDSPPPPLRLVCARTAPRQDILAVTEFLRHRESRVSLRMYAGSNEEVVARLKSGLADAAISDADLPARLGRDFRSILIRRRSLHFVATPDLVKRHGRFPACLQTMPLLLRPSNHPVRLQVDSFLSEKGFSPALAVESDDPEMILSMARSGEGACVIDPEEVARDLTQGRLALLHREKVGIGSIVRLVVPRRPPSHPMLRDAAVALARHYGSAA